MAIVTASIQTKSSSNPAGARAAVTNSAGTTIPNARLMVLLFRVSETSASPRPARPSRIAVEALGRLVMVARISRPTSGRGTP